MTVENIGCTTLKTPLHGVAQELGGHTDTDKFAN